MTINDVNNPAFHKVGDAKISKIDMLSLFGRQASALDKFSRSIIILINHYGARAMRRSYLQLGSSLFIDFDYVVLLR